MTAKKSGEGTKPPPTDPAAAAFARQMESGAGPAPWAMEFDTDRQGNPTGSLKNIVLVLENDARWVEVIALDEFGRRVMKRKAPPFTVPELGEWEDIDDTRLRVWLSVEYHIRAQKNDIQDAVAAVADKHRYNELLQYLEGLKWDGKRRLGRWLFTYLNVDDALTPAEVSSRDAMRYLHKVGVKALISAVARAYRPGCQVDTMMILEGPQGLLKSTVWRVMGMQWFTDAYLHLQDKDAFAIIQGMWIVEWSELEGLTRAEASTVKRFLTTHKDRYRTWYGKRAGEVPRTCVFVGTVNLDEYLKDIDNRRFWPVRCGQIDIAALRRDRDQLWAEAVRWYKRGLPWWVRPRERKLFVPQQEARYVYDALEDKIKSYLLDKNEVTTAEILENGLSMRPERWSLADQQRVGRVMKRLKWERHNKARGWVYTRPEA
jgi:putative DNA primase/helicase